MATRRELLDLQFEFGVPTFLVRELKQRNALPTWWSLLTQSHHGDWLANFHRAFSQKLPQYMRDVAAGSIQTSLSPQAHVLAERSTIAFPIGTVVLLHEVLEIVTAKMTPPESHDPSAHMLLSGDGRKQSVQQLQTMIGRLRATNSPDCANEITKWRPGVVAAAHFMYVHELIHVSKFHRMTSTTSFSR